jgi:hypothetical protein
MSREVKGFYTDDKGRVRPITRQECKATQKDIIRELKDVLGEPLRIVRRGKYLIVNFDAYYDDGDFEFPYDVEIVFPLDDPSKFQLRLDKMTKKELRKRINSIFNKLLKAGYREGEVLAAFSIYDDPEELIGEEKYRRLRDNYGDELDKLAYLLTLEELFDGWEDEIGMMVD